MDLAPGFLPGNARCRGGDRCENGLCDGTECSEWGRRCCTCLVEVVHLGASRRASGVEAFGEGRGAGWRVEGTVGLTRGCAYPLATCWPWLDLRACGGGRAGGGLCVPGPRALNSAGGVALRYLSSLRMILVLFRSHVSFLALSPCILSFPSCSLSDCCIISSSRGMIFSSVTSPPQFLSLLSFPPSLSPSLLPCLALSL